MNDHGLRRAKDSSQEAFADDAGVHRTYGSDIGRAARDPTITIDRRGSVPYRSA